MRVVVTPPSRIGSRRSGFTLLEVLVVVFIIGIMVTMGVMSVRGVSVEEQMAEEVKRMDALLQLAQEEAILRSQEIGVHLDTDNYSFLLLDGREWRAIEDDKLFRKREMPEGVRLSLTIEEYITFAVNNDSETSLTPQILLLSSGEITPFSLEFTAEDSGARITLKATIQGQFERGQEE